MKWHIVKMGIEMFDALHAYGLGVALATVSNHQVAFKDTGLGYELTTQAFSIPSTTSDLLDHIVPLPTHEEVLAAEAVSWYTSCSLALATFDGLLAALFTTPAGARVANSSYLRMAQRLSSETATSPIQRGLQKVAQRIGRWKSFLEEEQEGKNWMADLLKDYVPDAPAAPFLVEGHKKTDNNVLMTLDPSFGYSFRKPIHTGNLLQKSNVSLQGTRYGALLAFIGAARFLRAQYLSNDLVNFYIPIAEELSFDAQTTLSLLPQQETYPDHALIRYWLSFPLPEGTWRGVSYQILQRQGHQQSITCGSGHLSYQWLRNLEQQLGKQITVRWSKWLGGSKKSPQGEKSPVVIPLDIDEQQHLIACLKHRQVDDLYRHLSDLVPYCLKQGLSTFPFYTIEEARRIAAMTNYQAAHPLRIVLERKEGTLSFGRALRQLGRYNPSLLREFLEQLETVQTEEGLLFALHRLTYECELATSTKASERARYIPVPGEEDFGPLLDDVQQFGVRRMVGVLMVLSALRYPHGEEVDKYAVHTLIRALLLLNRNVVPTPEGQEEQPPAAKEFETLIMDTALYETE